MNDYNEKKRQFADQLRQIKSQVSIIEYAQIMGYTPIRKGKYYSLKEHDSVIIDPVGNMFWRNAYRGEPHWCGSIIDFICHFEGKSEREAILELSDLAGGVHSVPAEPMPRPTQEKRINPVKEFQLPEKDRTNQSVFEYLTETRMISPEIVIEYIHKGYIYQDTRKNCVFVGFDQEQKPCFACKRGTVPGVRYFQDVEGSNYDYCTVIDNGSKSLVVTEAHIDGFSLMTLIQKSGGDPHNFNYLFLSGTNKYEALLKYLERNPTTKSVILGLDNDTPGITVSQKIKELLAKNAPQIKIKERYPLAKDWNADLVALASAEQLQKERYCIKQKTFEIEK